MKRINFKLSILLLLGASSVQVYAQDVLSWDDCVKEAAKNHPDLISAQEKINQQKSAKTISASALYPQIDSHLNASTQKSPGTISTVGPTKISTKGTTSDSYSYGVNGTQLIFDGFKTVNNVNSARENIKASEANYHFASSQIRFNLRNAYVNLLKAQELIQVSGDIVKIRHDDLVLITLRYQSGLEHKGALLTAEANLAQANFQLSQAKRDVVLAQRQLTKEMGRAEFKPMTVTKDFTIRDSAKEKPDFEVLIRTNPSILQAAAKKNAAYFNVRSSYANFLPTLSAQAGADRTSAFWPPRNSEWNLGLGVTMPIFEGGLRLAQISQAQAAFRQTEADERSIRDGVIVSLEQTWVALQDAIETVDVQLKSLQAAEERSKIAEVQFSTGFITFDNWTIIEDALVRAKTDYLNAQTNALTTEASWIQAKGETLEYAQ